MERARAAIHAEWEPDALSRSRWSAAHALKEIEEGRPRQRESAGTANPESLAVLRKYLPESTKIFEEMLEELI